MVEINMLQGLQTNERPTAFMADSSELEHAGEPQVEELDESEDADADDEADADCEAEQELMLKQELMLIRAHWVRVEALVSLTRRQPAQDGAERFLGVATALAGLARVAKDLLYRAATAANVVHESIDREELRTSLATVRESLESACAATSEAFDALAAVAAQSGVDGGGGVDGEGGEQQRGAGAEDVGGGGAGHEGGGAEANGGAAAAAAAGEGATGEADGPGRVTVLNDDGAADLQQVRAKVEAVVAEKGLALTMNHVKHWLLECGWSRHHDYDWIWLKAVVETISKEHQEAATEADSEYGLNWMGPEGTLTLALRTAAALHCV